MIKIDKKYLPSRNFAKALSVAVVIVLIAIIINYWRAGLTTYQNDSLVADTTATSSWLNNSVDTDRDGLLDWQEVLYGTDPKKSDTDGDGTSDMEEVKLNREPLKANTALVGKEPNDKIDPKIIVANQKEIADYQKLTATEKVSRDLMSNIIASQPTSGSMDQNTINSIVDKAIQGIPQKQFYGITVQSDLNIIAVDSTTFSKDLLKYANVYATQTEAFREIMGDDLVLISSNSALSATEKEKIRVITSKYQNIINNLIAVPIPATVGSSGVMYHLTIINSLEKLIAIDKDIMNSNGDNAVVFSDLAMYNKTINELLEALSMVDSALKIQRQ